VRPLSQRGPGVCLLLDFKKVKIEERKKYIQNSSSLLTLQPRVGLVLLNSLLTLNFSGVVSSAPCPTPNLGGEGGHGLHFIWLLTYELSGIGGATRSIHSHQHSSLGHWSMQTSTRQSGSPRGVYTELGAFKYILLSRIFSMLGGSLVTTAWRVLRLLDEGRPDNRVATNLSNKYSRQRTASIFRVELIQSNYL
jgi:hypothetical protein